MTEEKIIVGLDIGTTKICAVVGKQSDQDPNKVDILGVGSEPSYGVVQGMVSNLDKTVSAITQAIRKAGTDSRTELSVVNVGIAGEHIKNSVHRNFDVRKNKDEVISTNEIRQFTKDMYRVVVQPGNEIIHVMPQDYVIDGGSSVQDPVGMIGADIDASFNVITANTTAISNINKCVHKSGLEIDYLVLEPIASSLSVLTDEEKAAGVCLVDIGGGTTDMAIFVDGIIRHTAVIPMGGQIITSDIKEGCKIQHAEAEKLKVVYGKALPEALDSREIVTVRGLKNHPPKEISCYNLALIIQARLMDIIEQVHYKILQSGYKERLGAGIVVTGGGALLQGIQHIFEYMTGQNTRLGYPNEYLGKCAIEEIKSPMYATALGLVLVDFTSIDHRDMPYIATNRNPDKTGGRESLLSSILKRARTMLKENMNDKME